MKRRNGFTLIEFSLVLIGIAILGLLALQQQLRASKKEVARIQADQLEQISEALNSYSDLYRRELVSSGDLQVIVNGLPVVIPETAPGATSPEGSKLSPTIGNLISVGVLPSTFLDIPIASNGNFITRLSRQPSNCSLLTDDCRIEGYVTINSPVSTAKSETDGNLFDGDLVGDILGFMGGNGFATLSAGAEAVSAGGNFRVSVDLTNSGPPVNLASIPAGLVGIRVGATASRLDVRDPIPGVDFCTGNNVEVGWAEHPNGTNGIIYPAGTLASAATGDGPAQCRVNILSDTPVGYRFIQTDADSGGGTPPGGGGGGGGGGASASNPAGSILLKCVFDESLTPPSAYFVALSSCCQGGNQACSPPPPPL